MLELLLIPVASFGYALVSDNLRRKMMINARYKYSLKCLELQSKRRKATLSKISKEKY